VGIMVREEVVKRDIYLTLELPKKLMDRLDKLKKLGVTYSQIGSVAFARLLSLPTHELLDALGVTKALEEEAGSEGR